MNLGRILAKVGTSIISSVVPGAGLVLDAVNAFLPDDKKLPADATGQQAGKAINSLPPNVQAEILSKELDVEIAEIKEWSNVIGSLAEVDKTGNSTRPSIAKAMSNLIIFGVIIILGPIAYAIVTSDAEMIDAVTGVWPLILAIIGIPAGIVNSYFGKRHKEKAQKYEAVSNAPPVAGAISQIIGMFRKS